MWDRRLAPLVLLAFALSLSGCLRDRVESPYHAPGETQFIKTVDINRHILMDGADAGGNGDDARSEYDLLFYAVGSTEVFGVRSGYFPDQYGHRISLRYMDLGETRYELVDALPENGTPAADYRPISQAVGTGDVPAADGHTVFRLDHVYAIYKWNAEGGNYLKLLVNRIDPEISRLQIRGTYQQRQGVTSVVSSQP